MEPNKPNTNPDAKRRPQDDNAARRPGEEQENPIPQADGDSPDEGDPSVEDAGADPALK